MKLIGTGKSRFKNLHFFLPKLNKMAHCMANVMAHFCMSTTNAPSHLPGDVPFYINEMAHFMVNVMAH